MPFVLFRYIVGLPQLSCCKALSDHSLFHKRLKYSGGTNSKVNTNWETVSLARNLRMNHEVAEQHNNH